MTLREQIEAIRKYTEAIPPGDRRGIDRDNLARAVAALAILSDAERRERDDVNATQSNSGGSA